MTAATTPMRTGDAGQLGANTTVRFGLGGREYEIDLSARHASELRYMIGRYLGVARKIKSAPTRPRPRHQSRPPTPTDRHQSRPQATAEPVPVSRGGATGKPLGRTGTPRAAQDEPARAASVPGSDADPRSGEHALTDRERRELRVIADTAQPQRTNVAGRLRTKGLADRDSAGNWWPTDAGRRELISA
jgi:Lsr2